ncbi:MAG: DUF2339 domain-containing protein [Burkholderiaceae bacterium]|jgi:uncharacterized membrane protein|nr:DUF2339 domain-containing protein [Burkholderiaceae bacterium]
MEVIGFGIAGIVLIAWLVLPFVLLAYQSTLAKRCALLQEQLKELVARYDLVSTRLARLEAADLSGPSAAAAPAAPPFAPEAVAARAQTPPPPDVAAPTVAAAAQAPQPVAAAANQAGSAKAAAAVAVPTTTAHATVIPARERPAAAMPATAPADALAAFSNPVPPPSAAEQAALPNAGGAAGSATAPLPKSPPRAPFKPAEPPAPTLLARALAWVWGGNAVLRVGVVLLFIGLAFLLRYASERVHLPVEYRYVGVALTALALLVLGWRLRKKQPAYGLLMQGAGIAVLYLTVFSAYRMHGLLPSGVTLVLLVSITVCSVILAVRQDALGLACAAALGGFAAPVLASTGSGNHVALFSYFALLSAGIALVAWFKAWRILNLIGFLSTFGIGIAWGARSYKPELFASTEPFLLLFFLLYVAIGLLFTRRQLLAAGREPGGDARRVLLSQSARRTDYLDGSLVFGPPIIGFGLQCAVIRHIEFGMAFSALALGLFYLTLAFALGGRETWRRLILLREVYLALGVVFGSLAVPLALDAQWTSAAWAVEGAGLYWLGLRQSRRLAQGFALLLMATSALAYLGDVTWGTATLLAAPPIGALLLGAALLFAHGVLRRDILLRGGQKRPTPQIGESILLPALVLPALGILYYLHPLVFAIFALALCWVLRDVLLRGEKHLAESGSRVLLPAFALPALGFLYLLPPLCFAASMTVVCWAAMGLVTLFAGLRLKSRAFLVNGLGIELLGGLVFLLGSETLPGTSSVLDLGLEGLLIALPLGVVLIACTLFVHQEANPGEAHHQPPAALATGLNVVVLVGLSLLNLAAFFKLSWVQVSAVWAASGLLILWVGLLLQRRPVFYFGALMQAVGGMAFMLDAAQFTTAALAGVTPLLHFDFWIPAALALAALMGAWQFERVIFSNIKTLAATLARARRSRRTAAQSGDEDEGADDGDIGSLIGVKQLGALSSLLLLWGVGWWVWTGFAELARFVAPAPQLGYAALLALVLSAQVWMWLARRTAWRALALPACLLPPVAAVMVLVDASPLLRDASILLTPLGLSVWLVFFAAHLLTLRRLADLLHAQMARSLHVLLCWLLLAVLMQAAHDGMLLLSAQVNAWRWLGWALVPSLYLLWMSRAPRQNFWPMTAYARAYRTHAAALVAPGLLAWAVLANLLSDGAAWPLPYLPIVNPLEIGLLLVLLTVYRWSQGPFARHAQTDAPFCPAALAQALLGLCLFGLLTMAVCRSVHHWEGVAFNAGSLIASMSVQAGLSLVWTLGALVMMIGGHRRENRSLWMAGAALVGVVVVKLFFVELGGSGSLARVVSFIGVGVLLLIVGYFSPLPPRRGRDEDAPSPASSSRAARQE